MRLRPLLSLALGLLLAGALAGCGEGSGPCGGCNVDQDCASDLKCFDFTDGIKRCAANDSAVCAVDQTVGTGN